MGNHQAAGHFNMKKNLFLIKKGFTFIELLISIAIIAIIAGGAFLSPGISGDAVLVNQSAGEIKNAITELQDFGIGQDRDRIKHYVLIIKNSSGSDFYCNQGIGDRNSLSQNQYMICSTTNPDAGVDLNSAYKRVKGANISSSVSLNLSDGLTGVSPIVINVRTYDGQMGFNRQYYETDTTSKGTIDFNKSNIHKIIEIYPILNIVKIKE
jgi:prepilin-type N-terminal cleavage/methylation domain-containing protein